MHFLQQGVAFAGFPQMGEFRKFDRRLASRPPIRIITSILGNGSLHCRDETSVFEFGALHERKLIDNFFSHLDGKIAVNCL
jgi:hypothetical protein